VLALDRWPVLPECAPCANQAVQEADERARALLMGGDVFNGNQPRAPRVVSK
jgi:hypothetical protein